MSGRRTSWKYMSALRSKSASHDRYFVDKVADHLLVFCGGGEIKDFTGVSAPFEAPEHPDLTLDTSVLSLEESVTRLLELILPKVSLGGKQ